MVRLQPHRFNYSRYLISEHTEFGAEFVTFSTWVVKVKTKGSVAHKHRGGAEVQLQLFLISTLDWGEWSTWHSGRLTPTDRRFGETSSTPQCVRGRHLATAGVRTHVPVEKRTRSAPMCPSHKTWCPTPTDRLIVLYRADWRWLYKPLTGPFLFLFLGGLAKLRTATVCLSVCLSVRPSTWNNSAPTGRICMKFDIWVFFQNLSIKFKSH